MKRKLGIYTTFVIAIIFFFNLILSINAAEPATDDTNYRVLCILSYNYAYNTVPAEINGIEAGLKSDEYNLNISLTYESMDTKNFYKTTDVQEFYEYLSYKLEKSDDYDLLIVADDSALRFALNNRDTLFKDIPIVFMGVNALSEAQSAAMLDNITGIVEVPDFESNYELMKELFPERDTIVAIVDGTTTGQGEYVQFMNFIENYPDQKYRILNTSRYSKKGIQDYLATMDDRTIILYLDFVEDGEGNIYTLESAAGMISENVENVPIFRTSSADVENGVLGGVSYSFYDAGKAAGDMAARILMGTPATEIDMLSDTVTITYFDQNMMDEYGISRKDIPEDSVVINEKDSFEKWYRDNRLIANLVFLVAILLVIIILILAISNRKQEKMINSDPLTGIANRVYLSKLVKPLISHKQSYGIIIVDVDYFKQINDTKGHHVGDEVLVYIAKMLDRVAKIYFATAARVGGDEFIILVEGDMISKCETICQKLKEMIKAPIRVRKDEVQTSLSMGCAIYPKDTDDPGRVMTLADEALYVVKKHGRNDYHMYDRTDFADSN